MSTILLKNGSLVLPDKVISGGEVMIEDGIITQVGRMSHHYGRAADRVIDAQGGYILPGFIDTHSDAIEKELEPRPGAFFTTDVAFGELEKKLAGQGITTMYHSFSFAGAQYGVRADQVAADCIRTIMNIARDYASIRNKIHLRFEVTNFEAVDLVHDLIKEGCVELLSFMDHTPGQGQYPTIEDYRRYLEKTYHLQLDEIGEILKLKEQGRRQAGESVARLSKAAQTAGIPLASHDDDSPDSISYYQQQGVTLSEFPINLPTVSAARQAGVDVSVGAPNIVRGGSTGKGMRAIDAITAGRANILCSDYYPPALLHAVFLLAEQTVSMTEAVALATVAPAKALSLKDIGSLEEGKCGDVIVVRKRNNTPVVTNTIVGGVPVYTMNYRVTLPDDREEQSAS
ncbi:MAG: phosphonate metabolism protein PhnM [Firmicutes bacterium]|nr:phosphonate metabolism protein PhnM [Bacillota bacterium]